MHKPPAELQVPWPLQSSLLLQVLQGEAPVEGDQPAMQVHRSLAQRPWQPAQVGALCVAPAKTQSGRSATGSSAAPRLLRQTQVPWPLQRVAWLQTSQNRPENLVGSAQSQPPRAFRQEPLATQEPSS